MNLKHTLACAVCLACPPLAAAQENASVHWEVSAVSEYLFRSVSQTDENPTVQGSLNWKTPSGIYLGTWASGVDFGPGNPKAEVDYYLGYVFDLGAHANVDVQLARYTYPGASALAYNELVTTTTIAETWSIGFLYSNDIFGSDTDGWYVSLDKEWALPQEFSLTAHAGRSLFDDHAAVGSRDYTDWNIGLSRRFGIANVTLAYYGTDSHGRQSYGKAANNRVFLSVGIGN